jgi:hypothetical protein
VVIANKEKTSGIYARGLFAFVVPGVVGRFWNSVAVSPSSSPVRGEDGCGRL